MGPSRRRALAVAARALGMRLDRVDDGCYLVQERPARHEVVQVGRPRVGVRLLVHGRRARRHVHVVQRRLSEHLLAEQVAWVLRATEVNCVLDVGANVGQFGSALRKRGYTGRIVSFEPVRSAFARLSAAVADDPQWHAHRLALGSADGTAEIHTDPRTLSSLLPASEFGRSWRHRLREGGTEPVTVRRLDGLFGEVTAGLPEVRAYLKLDTQGFDLEAFRGGRLSRPCGRAPVRALLRAVVRRHAAVARAAGGLRGGRVRDGRHVPGLAGPPDVAGHRVRRGAGASGPGAPADPLTAVGPQG